MGTNYYLKVPQEREVNEEYLNHREDVVVVLKDHGVQFSDDRKTENFLQDILNALESETWVNRMTSECGAHIGKDANSFLFDMSPAELESYPSDTEVVDQYGKTMTMEQFRNDVINDRKCWDTEYVGSGFS